MKTLKRFIVLTVTSIALRQLFLFSITSAMLGTACTKDKVTQDSLSHDTTLNSAPFVLSGTYSGTFTSYRNQDSTGKLDPTIITGNTSVTFSGNNYSCTASPNGFPLGGSGTFLLKDYQNVTFNDANAWPIGTDLNLVLKGDYIYSFTADNAHIITSINISAYRNGKNYSYLLKK